MLAARRLKFAAAASLSSMVAAIAIAGPLAGTALAAKPQPTPAITGLTGPSQPYDTSLPSSATFTWNAVASTSYTCSLDGGKPAACTPSTPGVGNGQKQYSNLAQGGHTFVLKALASSGSTHFKATSATWAWTLDNLPPAVPHIGQVQSPTSNRSASISFSAGDASTQRFTCELDEVTPTPSVLLTAAPTCPSPFSTSPAGLLGDGSYKVVVTAYDQAGNHASAQTAWTVDLTAPWSPVVVAPASPTNLTSVDVSFGLPDGSPDAGTAVTYQCKLDAGNYSSCTSPYHTPALADGAHTLSVKATDAANNPSAAGSAEWTVDTVAPPAPTIRTGPASPTNQTSATFFFSNTEVGDALSCSVDGGAFQACTSPFTVPGLGAGTHTFAVKATDAASNSAVSSPAYSWTVNTSAPGPAYFLDGPDDPSNVASPTFDWAATDVPNTSGYACKLDGVDWPASGSAAVCDTTDGPVAVGPLTDGSHTFAVSALNGTAASAAVVYKWTQDTVAPAAPSFSTKPLRYTTDSTALFSFASDPGASFTCQLSGVDATPVNCASPLTYRTLADGAYTLTVVASDAANNTSTSAWTFTVDTHAPDAPTIIGDTTQGIHSAFTFSDNEPVTYACTLDGTPAACDTSGWSATASGGSHTLSVVSTDLAGNSSAAASVVFDVVGVAPAPPAFDSKPAALSNSTAFTWHDDDKSATGYQCKVDSADFAACDSGDPLTLADGPHTFTVEALNQYGNPSTDVSWDWTLDTHGPATPDITDGPVEGTLVNDRAAAFTVDDADSVSSLTCELDRANGSGTDIVSPAADCSGGSASYTALIDGDYTLVVTATDDADNPSIATRHWSVDGTKPQAPSVTSSIVDGGFDNTHLADFTVTDTSSDVRSHNCLLQAVGGATATAAPCTVDTSHVLSFSGLADGSYTLTVTSVDTATNESDPSSVYSFTVDTTKPVLTVSGVPSNVVKLTSVTPVVTLPTDAHQGSLVCSLTGPVPSSTCGTYSPLTDGAYHLTIDTTDQAGNAATQYVGAWTVDTTRPVLHVAGAPSGVVNAATVTLTTLNQTELHPNGITCSLTGPVASSTCGPFAGLTDGAYTLKVDTTDQAGNAATEVVNSWTVDRTKPVLHVVGAPSGVVNAASVTLTTLNQTELHPNGITCSLTGPVASSTCGPFSGLTDGAYTLKVNTTDQAGNAATEVVNSWTVDRTAPVLTVSGVPNGIVAAANVTPSITQVDANKGPLVCSLTGPLSQSGCGPYSSLTDGAYTLKVNTTDQAGNAATEVVKSWTVDRTAPVLTVSGVPSGVVTATSVSPSISHVDANKGPVVCSLTGPVASSTCGPYTGLADGAYTLKVDTTDQAGNKATEFVGSWTVNTAPVDSTSPTATIVATKTLTGASTVKFSETVHGLSTTGATLLLAGTTKVVPSKTVCLAGTTAVACGGNFTALRLTPKAALVPGQHYTVRLLAGAVKDTAGNPLVAKSLNFRGSRVEQETTPGAKTLWAAGKSKKAYGRSFLRENTKGASATYAFTGTSITWWTATGPNQGKAAVFIDGVRKGIVNNYAATSHFKVARAYAKLAKKRHTIRIVVRGVKGRKVGTGTYVTVDAYSVGKTRVNTPAVTTGWKSLAAKQLSGGHAATAKAKGEALTFVFRGTGITWVTERSRTQGKVAVYIDGVRKAVVDNYATTTRYSVKRALGHLADKVHTLKLVVLGTHHKRGTGTWVTVDRFLVT